MLCGLQFLHSHNFAHGDLHTVCSLTFCGLHPLHIFQANVLIDSEDRARLCDFGLSVVTSGESERLSSDRGGCFRFMAPEQLPHYNNCKPDERPTAYSDMYSFSMVVVEVRFPPIHPCYSCTLRCQVYTAALPYGFQPNPYALSKQIISGRRPDTSCVTIDDSLHHLVTQCWAKEPLNRPGAEDAKLLVQKILLREL